VVPAKGENWQAPGKFDCQLVRTIFIFCCQFSQDFGEKGGARTMEIGPIMNQNLIFWPLGNVL